MTDDIRLDIVLKGESLDVQDLIDEADLIDGLEVMSRGAPSLHFGAEEVTLVINVMGSLASIVAFLAMVKQFLTTKKKEGRRFEIEFKTANGNITISTDGNPCDLQAVLFAILKNLLGPCEE